MKILKYRLPAACVLLALAASLAGCSGSLAAPAGTGQPISSVTEAPASPEPAPACEPIPYLGPINSDTVFTLDYYDGRTESAYHFRKEGVSGTLLDGTMRNYELYYGIKAHTEGSTLYYTAYSYLDGVEPVVAAILRDCDQYYRPEHSELAASCTEETSVDLGGYGNGLYTLVMAFTAPADGSTGTDAGYNMLSLYVNGGTAYIVSTAFMDEEAVRSSILAKPALFEEIAADWGVTPENSLAVTPEDICYPTYEPARGHHCETDEWRELAHEIVPDESLPDSLKAAMLHDWMTENLAYDVYVATELDCNPRDNVEKQWDGSLGVYRTHAGICRDFVNIYLIMCRELGIPCTTADSKGIYGTDTGHTWTMVWLNGAWQDIDLTEDINRLVYGEDLTDVTEPETAICYDRFLTDWFAIDPPEDMAMSYSIYTKDFALYWKNPEKVR